MATQHHIVMLPFMAQGHLIPFLSLANLLSQRQNPSLKLTLVSTPLNLQNLKSLLPPNSPNIHLQSLPFTSADHNLPPDSENTDSLPGSLVMNLMLASETLEPHFGRLISDITVQDGRPPICIISDVFCSWSVRVAEERHVYHATFTTCGAYGTAAYMSIWHHLPHLQTASHDFNVPCFPQSTRFHRTQMSKFMRSTSGSASALFRKHIARSLKSSGMLCNTVEEVESAGMLSLRAFTGMKVWAVGPLHRHRPAATRAGAVLDECIEFLDSHKPASVMYISFGSQNTITASQMMALAEGLEASGKPFIWVVRPPIGFDLNGSFRQEWLPEGFEVRTKNAGQGILVRKWAPQIQILSHKSAGAFLSHCGWNSVVESLGCGVPLIGWPLGSDQLYNAKMLAEELGVCEELCRGLESEIGSGDVERVVRLVMSHGGKGEVMREKAVGYAKMIGDAMTQDGDGRGSSMKAIDDFVDDVLRSAEARCEQGVQSSSARDGE